MARLKWNWKKLFKARAVDNPYGWLRKLGFRHDKATRIANDKVDKISCEDMEKLCKALNCTPDDGLEYDPTEQELEQGRLALLELSSNPIAEEAAELMRGLTFKEIMEIARVLRKKKGKGKEKGDGGE